MIDEEFFNNAERPRGGRWIKLQKKGDRVDGTLISIEAKPRTDPDGNPVLSRKTQQPRKIYRVAIQTTLKEDDDDTGIRYWDANEAGKTALEDAYHAAGTRNLVGGRVAVAVAADPPDSFSQATYRVKFEPPAAKPEPVADLDELF